MLNSSKLDETAGIEFALNTSGNVDDSIDDKLALERVAFSTKTIEVSDHEENSPVAAKDVTLEIKQAEEDPYADDFLRTDSPDLAIGRSSFISTGSDKAYTGIDQVDFFSKVIAYLKDKISQNMGGGVFARDVDQKLDEIL